MLFRRRRERKQAAGSGNPRRPDAGSGPERRRAARADTINARASMFKWLTLFVGAIAAAAAAVKFFLL